MYRSTRLRKIDNAKKAIKYVAGYALFFFFFWAFYWGFWLAFEKPHYDYQEQLFKEQLEEVNAIKK